MVLVYTFRENLYVRNHDWAWLEGNCTPTFSRGWGGNTVVNQPPPNGVLSWMKMIDAAAHLQQCCHHLKQLPRTPTKLSVMPLWVQHLNHHRIPQMESFPHKSSELHNSAQLYLVINTNHDNLVHQPSLYLLIVPWNISQNCYPLSLLQYVMRHARASTQ